MCMTADTSSVTIEQISDEVYHLTGSQFVSLWKYGMDWMVCRSADADFDRPARGCEPIRVGTVGRAMRIAMQIAAA